MKGYKVNRGLLIYGLVCFITGCMAGSIVAVPLGIVLIYGAFEN